MGRIPDIVCGLGVAYSEQSSPHLPLATTTMLVKAEGGERLPREARFA